MPIVVVFVGAIPQIALGALAVGCFMPRSWRGVYLWLRREYE